MGLRGGGKGSGTERDKGAQAAGEPELLRHRPLQLQPMVSEVYVPLGFPAVKAPRCLP